MHNRTEANVTARLIPIREVSEEKLPGIGLTTIYKLVNEGELQKINIGRRSFITADSIEAYIGRLSEAS